MNQRTKIILLGLALLASAPDLTAQRWPWSNEWYRQNLSNDLYGAQRSSTYAQPGQGVPLGQQSMLGPNPIDLLPGGMPPGFAGVNRNLPIFQGFPTFSASALGYAGLQVGLPVPFTPGAQVPGLPPAPTDPDAWPSWFKGDTAGAEGYTVDVGLLSVLSERIYYRTPDQVFVPLAFYDKFRVVRPKAEINVRREGEFVLTFRGGASLRSFGPIALRIRTLDEDAIVLQVGDIYRVWLRAITRPMRIEFSNGPVLILEDTEVYCELTEFGFLSLQNRGRGQARVTSEVGTFEISPLHRARIFLRGSGHPGLTAELQTDGDLRTERRGRVLEVSGRVGGGRVTWNGARFRLPEGATLEIDPLAGEAFPDNRPSKR